MQERLVVNASDYFPSGIESSKAARTLIDIAASLHQEERLIEISFNSSPVKTLSAMLILLRRVRRFIANEGLEGAVLSCLDQQSRAYANMAIEQRFDLTVISSDDCSLTLVNRFPLEMLHEESGQLVKIGSARRKMAMVIERDGDGCVWCGLQLSYFHPEATLDHVLPRSSDGSQDWRNMLLACKRCNHSRKRTAAEKWLARCLAKGLAVNVSAVEAAIERVRSEPSLTRAYHRQGNQPGAPAASTV